MSSSETGKNSDKDLFIQLFNQLFILIRDLLSSVNKLVSEVGKHRASVNESIQIFRDRPCIVDESITAMEADSEKCSKCALTRLDGMNKHLLNIIAGIFILLFLGVTGTLAGLGIYVAQHEDLVLKILSIWGGR